MAEKRKKTVVLVIPSEGFNYYEYSTIRQTLEDGGVRVYVASDNPVVAESKDDKESVSIDAGLESINADEFDGIFFIGGHGTLTYLDNDQSYRIARDARDMDLPHGAIDLAVRILARSGVLRGRQATGLDTDRQLGMIIGEHGGQYRVDHVMIDGMLVTGSTPNDSQKFAKAILEVLRKKEIGAPADIPKKRI